MIEKLSIKNFKSIKELEIGCGRVNLFIGEPNTGKANLLEALGLLSWCGYLNTNLGEYVRIQGTQDLFYDGLLDQTVEIDIENGTGMNMKIKYESDKFHFESRKILEDGTPATERIITVDYSGKQSSGSNRSEFAFIKLYRFIRQYQFPESNPSSLMPPHGSNMFAVVMASKKLRKTMSNFFKDYGFYPVLKPQDKTFEFQKRVEDQVVHEKGRSRVLGRVEQEQKAVGIIDEDPFAGQPEYLKEYDEKDAINLTDYAVKTRYPGGREPVTKEEYGEALIIAESVYHWVSNRLLT